MAAWPAAASPPRSHRPAALRPASAARGSDTAPTSERTLGTTRSTDRVPLVNHRVPKAKGKLWTTADLDLRTEPREKARTAGLLDGGKQVPITGQRRGEYAEVIIKGATRWVTADYLSKEKAPEAMGLSDAPCPDGSGIESAIQPQAVKVYRAACAAFPELTTYGGQDGHGEHVNGEAIDFMVPDSGTGQRAGGLPLRAPRRARPVRHHLEPAHLDDRALRRGLPVDGGPRLVHGQPLRPRAHQDQLTRSAC